MKVLGHLPCDVFQYDLVGLAGFTPQGYLRHTKLLWRVFSDQANLFKNYGYKPNTRLGQALSSLAKLRSQWHW